MKKVILVHLGDTNRRVIAVSLKPSQCVSHVEDILDEYRGNVAYQYISRMADEVCEIPMHWVPTMERISDWVLGDGYLAERL